MYLVKLKYRQTSDDDIWLDEYKLTDKGVEGSYTTKTGRVQKTFVPNENIGAISDVGERNPDWNKIVGG